MSFTDVNNLRKAGHLAEAYAQAQADLNAEPDNMWNKRGMGWVLFDQLKASVLAEEFGHSEKILTAIVELGLPGEETMLWEQLCWQIGKMAFSIQKTEHTSFNQLDRLFQTIAGMPLPKPAEPFSFLLKAFQKSNKTWPRYEDFIEWWGLEHLRPEDFIPQELQDGKKGMALAEQAAIAYARKLAEPPVNKEKIEAFFPVLDQLIHDHPEYQYPPYFKGKLLLAIGDKENVFSAFLLFARKKQTEFWMWEMLAETFDPNDIRHTSCLGRALLCRTEPKFLGKVRAKLAEWLIANQHLPEAKTEIETIASVYHVEGWGLPPAIQSRMQEDWYRQTAALPDNRAFYRQFEELADEILFGDVPEEVVVVDFVNRERNVLYFAGENTRHGAFKYGKTLRNVCIGDLVRVRFSDENRDGMFRVFMVRPAINETNTMLRRTFEGKLTIRSAQAFGFVEDVYVEPELVQKHRLNEGLILKGECILSWNKKQNKMAWKAIAVSVA